MEIYAGAELGVYHKSDQSPVTLADLQSHRIIQQGLARLGDLPLLSEEASIPPWEVRRTWQEYWLIDPLDGTREFIKRNGEFTINIALIRLGEPVLGIVYTPAQDNFYWGGVNIGAFRQQGYKGSAEQIHCAPAPSREESWRVVGSRSYHSPELGIFLQSLERYELTPVGSSLKFCLVAEGKADLYPRFGPTCEWDTAAAQAVVEAAGAHVLNWESLKPLRYNQKDTLLNPNFIVCAEPAGPGAVG